jgi:hypothetical protein
MMDTHRCDDKDLLVAFLYDEIEAPARRRVEEHLRICAACAAELSAFRSVRESLRAWAPPEAALVLDHEARQTASVADAAPSGDVLRPARWWRSGSLPGWAQAAAAVLVVASALSIANLRIQYGADGLSVSTGWMAAPARPANGPLETTQTVLSPDNAEWRTALTSLERELRGEIQSLRARSAAPVTVSQPRSAPDEATMRRMTQLVEDSENRQKRELALRLAQFGRDIEVQRRTDNRRNVQAIGQFEALSGAEIARQRQIVDYIMRVSTQPPPQ